MYAPSRLNLVRALVFVTALAVVPVFSACNKPRKVLLNKRQKKKIEDSISESEPKMKKLLNIQFDDRVRLVGTTLKQSKVKPGGSFSIEYTWYVNGVVDDTDWKIFVHVDGNGKRFGADHHGVGGLFPMKKWPRGKYVTYEQKIKIPKDAKAANAGIWIGVFDEQAHKAGRKVRMKVVNDPKKLKLRMDRDGRIEIGNIEITGRKGQTANMTLPQYAIAKTNQPVKIDGVLNDPAWRGARNTRMFISGQGRPLPGRQATYAKLSWDDTYLYAGFVAKDPDIFSEFEGRDSTLWKQDCIEVYLDPGVTHRDYVELQISPTGEIFDALFSSRRRPEWPKAASRLTMSGMKVGIKAQGSVNKSGDGIKDKQWTLEIAIPWTDIPTVTGPPKDGEAWGMNFYRVDVRAGGKGKMHGHWSPAGNDFHNTNRFATVRFSSKSKPARRPTPKATPPRSPKGVPGAQGTKKGFVAPVPSPGLLKNRLPSTGVKGGIPTPVKVVPTRTKKPLSPPSAPKIKPAAPPKVK